MPFELPWLLYTKKKSFNGPTVFLNSSYQKHTDCIFGLLKINILTSTSVGVTSSGNFDNKILLPISLSFDSPTVSPVLFAPAPTFPFHAGAGITFFLVAVASDRESCEVGLQLQPAGAQPAIHCIWVASRVRQVCVSNGANK